MSGTVGFLAGTLRWAERITDRVEAVELARTVWMILDQELRPGLPGRDWVLESEVAVSLRAFRGLGRVCGPASSGWRIAYRGARAPDPVRDSVLVLGSDGGWRAGALVGVGAAADPAGACAPAPGESLRRLEWSLPDDVPPVFVRVFERGRYSFEDRALRYRRGSGGRQPLTLERVGEGSRLRWDGTALHVVLDVDGAGAGRDPVRFEWRFPAGEGGVP